MTTNTEHRRRETDRLGPYVQQVALDNANARIAELELEVYELEGFCHLARREIAILESGELLHVPIMRINEALDRVMPTAEKQGEAKVCKDCHGKFIPRESTPNQYICEACAQYA